MFGKYKKYECIFWQIQKIRVCFLKNTKNTSRIENFFRKCINLRVELKIFLKNALIYEQDCAFFGKYINLRVGIVHLLINTNNTEKLFENP